MATFKYLAFNGQEKKISGYINATDQVEAISMLQSKGLNPLSVTQSEQKKSKIKISKRDLSIFTKQMSALLSAGTPLEKSLELLSLQTTNNKFSQVLLNIMEDVTEGNSLSSSLKKFPRIFDEIYTSTIYAGETSAALAEVFSDLSEYLDKETQIKSQVTGALVYPSILFFVSLAVIYALLTFVLPQVVEQFVSSNVSLPLLTQVLLNFSTVFPYLVFSLLGIFASCYLLLQSNFLSTEFKISVSKLFLKTPLFGQIILFDQTARFCSSMRLMTKAGLNTIDSLHIAKDTFKNKYLKNEVSIVVSKVNAGTSISQAFALSKIFPAVFHQLLSSGDMGSQISEMFEKIKNFLDQEVETRRNVLLTLLQPIVILTMGAFVMLIVLAIMLPLLQMNNLIFNI
tara:strand:- start:4975 stop:6171 length:1197 start_codon:yes stop_codon:yes gene_type:complete